MIAENVPGFISWYPSKAGLRIPLISSRLTFADTIGSWKARWGLGRMSYLVPPGLYALGAPDESSPVIVTANYKMTYDLVRKGLAGKSLWLLVLETYGINVWCAAGKGTFGTGETVRRVKAARLTETVTHRQLILPILGASGVKAVEVQRRTGFKVIFATIRIEDLPAFLDQGEATEQARELTFTASERLVLTPVEMATALRRATPLLLLLFIAAGFFNGSFNLHNALLSVSAYLTAVFAGSFLSPLLLPWLPSPAFSVKGAVAGLFAGALFCILAGIASPAAFGATTLLITAVSSFLMLNFTGSTPFTSQSGVKTEMRWALPVQAFSILAGAGVMVLRRFF